MAAAVAVPWSAGAQGSTRPTPHLPAHDPVYVRREAIAPPAIRAQLAELRREIERAGLRYTVGYTSALDRSPASLTGLIVPPDALQRAREFAGIQASRLERERTEGAKLALHPPPGYQMITPRVPSFTASSPHADWRVEGMVPPIRDQGECGSCWAFATLGAYESAVRINGATSVGASPDSSEQAMLSCSGAGDCAKGGRPSLALEWLIAKGTDTESAYPYTAAFDPCKPFTPQYRAVAWGYVDNQNLFPSLQAGRLVAALLKVASSSACSYVSAARSSRALLGGGIARLAAAGIFRTGS